MNQKLSFICTLLSDVIINQKAATEGNQTTLDFLPGNLFLGVAASSLYEKCDPSDALLLFHSGKVRFGDAHPLSVGQRALRIPAAWYFRKGDDDSDIFVFHGLSHGEIRDELGNRIQGKQRRGGFMIKRDEATWAEIAPTKNFAIKSAYDATTRRAKDAAMYGYESLAAGSQWGFSVELDEEAPRLGRDIQQALTGIKRIGRSSTAQYGLVKIEPLHEAGFEERWASREPQKVLCYNRTTQKEEEREAVLLYAESRLIFMDLYGQPTFTPTVAQLGGKRGEICWEKCQIRTFQYAPFNSHRKTRDADRCGMEKGSVICIVGASPADYDQAAISRGLGCYLNEGFGKVIVNPEFLSYEPGSGKLPFSQVELPKADNSGATARTGPPLPGDEAVLGYLRRQQQQEKDQEFIYTKVNGFVNRSKALFLNESFASQWGTIRSMAMGAESLSKLSDALFEKSRGYLAHGIAAEKWEGARLKKLKEFVEGMSKISDGVALRIMVNLASEMAKKCKEGRR